MFRIDMNVETFFRILNMTRCNAFLVELEHIFCEMHLFCDVYSLQMLWTPFVIFIYFVAEGYHSFLKCSLLNRSISLANKPHPFCPLPHLFLNLQAISDSTQTQIRHVNVYQGISASSNCCIIHYSSFTNILWIRQLCIAKKICLKHLDERLLLHF